MSKRYVILIIFLGISISLIIFSLNVARQNLNEALISEKQKAAFMGTAKQKDILTPTRMPADITQEKKEDKAEEFILLEDIPDDYFKEEEKVKESQIYEEDSAKEREIRKQPSLKELRELKRKGAIIY